MPPRRITPIKNAVTISLDGQSYEVDPHATLATSLVGHGIHTLARSPKFHRPRGPSCMRGNCDGCLVRVDGQPNIMSCQTTAIEGMVVERQNFVFRPELDLLRMTDWFFPRGMNHHELMAGIPGVQSIMQSFARRVSGLGQLPELHEPSDDISFDTVQTDVLVVGAGPSGLAITELLSEARLRVVLVDEQPRIGGSFGCFPQEAHVAFSSGTQRIEHWYADQERWLACSLVTYLGNSIAIGVFESKDWLVYCKPDRFRHIKASAVVLAQGAYDVLPSFEGNDLPGVYSARAANKLLSEGVLVGDQVLLLGEGMFNHAFASVAESHGASVVYHLGAQIREARGVSFVKGAILQQESQRLKLKCDAIVFDGDRAPAFELAQQAGASTKFNGSGYAVQTDRTGCCASTSSTQVYAMGELVGDAPDPVLYSKKAEIIANRIVENLRADVRS